ncbi:hypothetical protein [Nonomuraea angiospora]
MAEHVRMERSQVEAGLKGWQGHAAGLGDALRDATARIERLNAAAPWGGDSAGQEFYRAYSAEGGPDTLIAWAGQLMRNHEATGEGVRQTVETTSEAASAPRGDRV